MLTFTHGHTFKTIFQQSEGSGGNHKVVEMVYGVLEALFWITNGDPISETNFGQRDSCKILNKIYHINIFMYI